jgi:hypothetical protein
MKENMELKKEEKSHKGKLKLNKETIRMLKDSDLWMVAGGRLPAVSYIVGMGCADKTANCTVLCTG